VWICVFEIKDKHKLGDAFIDDGGDGYDGSLCIFTVVVLLLLVEKKGLPKRNGSGSGDGRWVGFKWSSLGGER